MQQQKYRLGLIGLGTMGRNLLLNMADSDFPVTGYDLDLSKLKDLEEEAKDHDIYVASGLEDMIAVLKKPRVVMMLVPAGKIVDSVINDVLPHLEKDDIIIDGGNSYFSDTHRRQVDLEEKGIHFIGLGVSGGAEGARRGPSMMPGCSETSWNVVKDLFEAIAAKVDGDPCVAYLGNGPVGHYVKMIHNGIEYGLMQLISECYDIMKRGLGLDNDAIAKVFSKWQHGKLDSFLIDITAAIFQKKDDLTGGYLVDQILDKSKQKGTGKWTSQDAMDLQAPLPVIDAAVTMRDMSGYKEERLVASQVLTGPEAKISDNTDTVLEALENALYFAYIATYAQGMEQMRAASEERGYGIDLGVVARIWRGGCIIRARLLEDFRKAYSRDPKLANLMVDPHLASELTTTQTAIRYIVRIGLEAGLPIPGFMNAVAYFDAYRSSRLPANLIQAQRDFFGAHTYERLDRPGIFHSNWKEA